MFNLLYKQAIIKYSQVQHRRHYQVKKDFDQDIRRFAPNFKHKNGKIYASKKGESYWVATVSPYHPRFRSQIEDGVWPLVEPLINKGYLTVSSCEGHGIDEELVVTLVFETVDQAKNFSNICSQVPGWEFIISHQQRTIHQSGKTNTGLISEKVTRELNSDFEEFKRYNLLFFKNYQNYVYLDMMVCKFSKNLFKHFWYRFVLRRPCQEFYVLKQNMVDFLNKHLPENTCD